MLRHYRFDASRHEFRHQVIAAYDDRSGFEDHFDRLSSELEARRATGVADTREYVSGVVLEPGHNRQWRNARLLRNAIRRGINLSTDTYAGLAADLPPGVVERVRND